MKYVVVISDSSDELLHVFAGLGGGWLDPDSAEAWAKDYSEGESDLQYQVVALEMAT